MFDHTDNNPTFLGEASIDSSNKAFTTAFLDRVFGQVSFCLNDTLYHWRKLYIYNHWFHWFFSLCLSPLFSFCRLIVNLSFVKQRKILFKFCSTYCLPFLIFFFDNVLVSFSISLLLFSFWKFLLPWRFSSSSQFWSCRYC